MMTKTGLCVWTLAGLLVAGSVWAGKELTNGQFSQRPVASATVSTPQEAEQPWQGATLQTPLNPAAQPGQMTRKQQMRQQLNLQYTSKRPYVDARAPD